jgi:hypothetical protein
MPKKKKKKAKGLESGIKKAVYKDFVKKHMQNYIHLTPLKYKRIKTTAQEKLYKQTGMK